MFTPHSLRSILTDTPLTTAGFGIFTNNNRSVCFGTTVRTYGYGITTGYTGRSPDSNAVIAIADRGRFTY